MRRALIVDDQFVVRQSLKAILSEGGYQVVGEATNGEQALLECDRLRPDLLCLDIVMPRKDGLEVLEQVRLEYPRVVVVMISAERSTEQVRRALDLGARGFILKPFRAEQVLTSMSKALGTAAHY